jgi:hypothetical protein
LLAVPLTVCLFVAGKYMRQLRFFSVMLGEEPVLEHYQRLYQRLLAQDAHELQQILTKCIADTSQLQCLDRAVIPVLQLAEGDLARGVLEVPVHYRMLALLRATLRGLDAKFGFRSTADDVGPHQQPNVLCIAAGDSADSLVAELLASALNARGITAAGVRIVDLGRVTNSPAFVWICALPPTSLVQASQLCKQVRRRFTAATIGVGLWNADRTLHKSMERMRIAGAQRIATSLARAVQMTAQTLQSESADRDSEGSDRRAALQATYVEPVPSSGV